MEASSEESVTERFLKFNDGKAKHLLASIKTAADNKDAASFNSSFSEFLDLSHTFSHETCMAINLTNDSISSSSTTGHIPTLVAVRFLKDISLPKDLTFVSSIHNIVSRYADKVTNKDYTASLIESFFNSFWSLQEDAPHKRYVKKAAHLAKDYKAISFEDLKRLSNEFSIEIAEANKSAAVVFVLKAAKEIHNDIHLEHLSFAEQAEKRNDEAKVQPQMHQKDNNTPKL